MTQPPPSRWQPIVRWAYVILVLVAFGYTLITQRAELVEGLRILGPFPIGYATLFALGATGLSGVMWYVLLRGLGGEMAIWPAFRLFFGTQLGKYVPGALWPVLMQADMARSYQVPVRVMVLAQVLFMWVYVVTAALVGLPTALIAISPTLPGVSGPVGVVALVLLIVLLHPAITQSLVNTILRLSKRDPLPVPIRASTMVGASGLAIGMWGLFGGHLYMLNDVFSHKGWITIPALDYANATTLFAAAWLVGFVIVIAPAGLGPREVVLVSGLIGSHAVVVAAVSRLVLTLADGLCAAIAWTINQLRHEPRSTGRAV